MAEAEPPPSNSEDNLPRMLGKYKLLRLVGRGGMGAVYEAEDVTLKRLVAIKVLPDEVTSNPEAARRFLLEAQAVARLNHPHVVTIYEVARQKDSLYLAMEFIDGGSVADLLRRQRALPWRDATQIVLEACRGLAAAHEAKLIHRDIKPANLLRKTGGYIKLADFGLSKALDRSGASITGSGRIVGTPHYMSPEQCRQDEVTEASDLYSLGATYFALLTGSPPFPGEQPMQVMFAHCGNPIPDPRTKFPDIPSRCAEIVQRCLAKSPHERFSSAAELVHVLENALTGDEAARLGTSLSPPPPPPMANGSSTLIRQAGDVTAVFPTVVRRDEKRLTRSLVSKKNRGLVLALAAMAFTAVVAAVVVSQKFATPPNKQSPANNPSSDTTSPNTGSSNGKSLMATDRSTPKLTVEVTAALREKITTQRIVTALAFSADAELLAIGEKGTQSMVRTRRLKTSMDAAPLMIRSRSPVVDGDGEANATVTSLVFSSNGKHLALGIRGGSCNGSFLFRATERGEWEEALVLFPMGPSAMAFGAQDSLLTAVFMQTRSKSHAMAWQIPSGVVAEKIPVVSESLKAAAIIPGSPLLLVTGGREGELYFANLETGKVESRFTRQLIRWLAASNDGRYLAVGTPTTLELWSRTKDWRKERELAVMAEQIVFSRDDRFLFVAGGANSDGAVRVIDRASWRVLDRRAEHSLPINALAISPNGKLLASGGDDKMVCIWNVDQLLKDATQSEARP